MNQFQIVEEVGRGKYSIVYKGRKKRTIEYIGVKSVDKVHRRRVLNEVAILHSLHHPNVLAFNCWYETNNHLWLIVEFCAGGSLFSLLSQDVKLPESTIQLFGQDILCGLRDIHAHGVVMCELKPSNILINGHSMLKLADFRLAQRVAGNGAAKYDLRPKQGTPCYMAPELFLEDGVHSFASDIWSFGCVLYEMAVGQPPFVSRSFEELWQMIMTEPTPRVPGFSDLFNDLISKMLTKNPAKRARWEDISTHPWWIATPPPCVFPAQPKFEQFLLDHPNWRQEMENHFGVSMPFLAEEASSSAPSNSTFREGVSSGVSIPTSNRIEAVPPSSSQSRIAPAGASGASQVRKSTMLTRLSQIVKSNLERRQVDASYRRSLAGDALEEELQKMSVGGAEEEEEGVSGSMELIVTDKDFEVFFNEDKEEDDGSREVGEGSSSPSEGSPTQVEEEDGLNSPSMGLAGSSSSGVNPSNSDLQSPSFMEEDIFEEDIEEDIPKSSKSSEKMLEGLRPQTAPFGPAKPSSTAAEKLLTRPKSAFPWLQGGAYQGPDVEHLLFHATDNQVKPIIMNSRIETITFSNFDPKLIPFKTCSLREMLAMDKLSLENFLTMIYRTVGHAQGEKNARLNTLSYFETLCCETQAANIFVNSSLMNLFVKMLESFQTPTMKCRILTIMGLLIRHASWISPRLNDIEFLGVLCNLLKDGNSRLRRRAISCLGELLFYIATQQLDATVEEPSWVVDDEVIKAVINCLKSSEDDIVQHYAAKTIENIGSLSPEFSFRFAVPDCCTYLLALYYSNRNIKDESKKDTKNNPKADYLRLTVTSALVRLSRQSKTFADMVLEKGSVRFLSTTLHDTSVRVQCCGINLINLAITRGMPSRVQSALLSDLGVLRNLMGLLESSNSILQSKALLCCALLMCVHHPLLHFMCEHKLCLVVDKVSTVNNADVTSCVEVLGQCIRFVVPEILDETRQFLGDMVSGGKGSAMKVSTPNLVLGGCNFASCQAGN